MKNDDPTTWDSFPNLDSVSEQFVEILQDLALLLIEYDSDYSVELKLPKEMLVFYKSNLTTTVTIEDSKDATVYSVSLENGNDGNFDYADDAFDYIIENAE